jgi:hypothetical protein
MIILISILINALLPVLRITPLRDISGFLDLGVGLRWLQIPSRPIYWPIDTHIPNHTHPSPHTLMNSANALYRQQDSMKNARVLWQTSHLALKSITWKEKQWRKKNSTLKRLFFACFLRLETSWDIVYNIPGFFRFFLQKKTRRFFFFLLKIKKEKIPTI